MRIIPPLRGLERVFCCSWCQFNLFNLASVIRTDLDLRPLREMLTHSADEKNSSGVVKTPVSNRKNPFAGGSGGSFKDDQGFAEHFPEDNGADSKSMPAPSLGMSRGSSAGGSSTNMSPPVAPPKPVYREPPKTMRNRGAKSFDFDGFGGSPEKATPMPTQNEECSKMEIDSGNEEESEHCDSSNNAVGGVNVPMLSIGAGGGGSSSSLGSSRNGTVAPRHSARTLQVSHYTRICNSTRSPIDILCVVTDPGL